MLIRQITKTLFIILSLLAPATSTAWSPTNSLKFAGQIACTALPAIGVFRSIANCSVAQYRTNKRARMQTIVYDYEHNLTLHMAQETLLAIQEASRDEYHRKNDPHYDNRLKKNTLERPLEYYIKATQNYNYAKAWLACEPSDTALASEKKVEAVCSGALVGSMCGIIYYALAYLMPY